MQKNLIFLTEARKTECERSNWPSNINMVVDSATSKKSYRRILDTHSLNRVLQLCESLVHTTHILESE